MEVKLKKIHPDAKLPVKGSEGASGFDVFAVEDVMVGEHPVVVHTGIQVAYMTPGYEIQVRPRSGNTLKLAITVSNAPGTVDNDYRGELCVIMHCTTGVDYNPESGEICEACPTLVRKGSKIAQLVIAPVIDAVFSFTEEVENTVRGAGGFGSTGG